jgi:hypothetical protein
MRELYLTRAAAGQRQSVSLMPSAEPFGRTSVAPLGHVFSLAPLLRGEGWGEGLLQQVLTRGEAPHPKFALRISTSPRKRGEVTTCPLADLSPR